MTWFSVSPLLFCFSLQLILIINKFKVTKMLCIINKNAHLNEQTFLKKKLITDITLSPKCPCPDWCRLAELDMPKVTYPEKKFSAGTGSISVTSFTHKNAFLLK